MTTEPNPLAETPKTITVWATSTQMMQFAEYDAARLLRNLAQALGNYPHLPEGCEDGPCPCRRRKATEDWPTPSTAAMGR